MRRYTSEQLLSPECSDLLAEIVSLLTVSFADDPVHKWLFSYHDTSEYVKILRIYFRFLLHLCLLSDAAMTVVTNDNDEYSIQAVSVLIPPHGMATFDSTIAAIRSGVINFFYELGFRRVYRLMAEFLPSSHEMSNALFRSQVTKYNVYLLMFIATHPDCQGQGMGTRLLQEEQAYVTKINEAAVPEAPEIGNTFVVPPLYLESSSVESKRLYMRLGFEHRATMAYGQAGEEEKARIAEDGTILGGKQFAMFWVPGEYFKHA